LVVEDVLDEVGHLQVFLDHDHFFF
jgi:hypothetical protein